MKPYNEKDLEKSYSSYTRWNAVS